MKDEQDNWVKKKRKALDKSHAYGRPGVFFKDI
jgi:hypothetical protein